MKYYSLNEAIPVRKAFGQAFVAAAAKQPKLIAVTADLGSSLSLDDFAAKYPQRYINCGVAEQNMVAISAGLALQGFIPFACTFGCFLTRAVDQIRQSIVQNQIKVVLVGSHGGISNAKDGPSAHAIEDLAIFRAFPDMTVIAISDANQMLKALPQIINHPKSVYLRLYREPLPVFTDKTTPFTIGKANILKSGKDITLISCGPIVNFCLQAAEKLKKQSISAEVIDCHTIKPIDKTTIINSVKKTKKVITVEDHSIYGGLGSAVAEVLAENQPAKLQRLGLTGHSTTGSYPDVLKYLKLDTDSIIKAVKKVISRKK